MNAVLSAPFTARRVRLHECRGNPERIACADASNPVDCLSRAWINAFYGNACIKKAFDLAIHDLAAQAAGLPLWQYLGGKAGEELFTDYTVSIGPVDRMVKDAMYRSGNADFRW